ncbi:hypothetical protein yaldo0001_38000 [Yersinia aldovae ATCC 35236]|nr:hypothetical protein yaldo0001_38000 [Yersinia aldovae ATCC 35236]
MATLSTALALVGENQVNNYLLTLDAITCAVITVRLFISRNNY